jgi:parvulin-like peptidyl-prolyl isomerase
MTDRGKTRRLTLGWRKILVGLGCAGVAVAGACVAAETVRPGSILTRAQAPAEAPPEAPAPPPSPEYSSSYVATFGQGRGGITREELGEYLIARYGEKVEHLINKRIMEDACAARRIEVTAAEVNQKLADDLKDLNVEKARFVREFLKARHMTEYEWKEDRLRPQLLMTKLCRDGLTVSEEEVHNAYEAAYGEKVACRVIEWSREPGDDRSDAALEQEARAAYEQAARDEAAFAEAARKQKNTALAAGGGQVKPFGRHTLEREELEARAFLLQPGEVSPLIRVPDGFVAIKCDQRIPANTSVPFEKVRAELAKDVLERKAQKEFPKTFAKLQEEAHPKRLLERKPDDEQPPYGYVRDAEVGLAKTRLVATLYDGRVALTREDLGEYLIRRYGSANLELLVNKRIIDNACRAANVVVTDAEVEAEFLADVAKHEKTRKKSLSAALEAMLLRETPRGRFIKEMLAPNKTSVYQYKEDIVRPRLQLARLCGDRVKVTEQDLQAAFEAHHGPKVECRMILWPNSEEYSKIVLQEYARLRDDPKAFDEKASAQASPTLAKNGGLLERPIGRHTTGNDALENEAFRLREGEVSSVIGTPEGLVVLKCVRHLPAEPVKLEEVRDELAREVVEKKTLAEMPVFFAELYRQAQPKLLLRDPGKGEDLDEVAKELSR